MANDLWHLWGGKNDRLNCVANNAHSWIILSMSSASTDKVEISLHLAEGDKGKDSITKMYTAITSHMQNIGFLPPTPKPLPPQEPEEEVIQIEVLLPKKE